MYWKLRVDAPFETNNGTNSFSGTVPETTEGIEYVPPVDSENLLNLLK